MQTRLGILATIASTASALVLSVLASSPPAQADPFGPRPELVRDIWPGLGYSAPERGVALGDRLLFVASTPKTGQELWVSDLTRGGTRLVKDIEPGPEPSLEDPFHGDFVVLGKRIYFTATTAEKGLELWTSDGTAAGTHLVKDIRLGAESSSPSQLVVAGGRLFFAAGDMTHGYELWISDGTSGGTHVVTDIASAGAPSGPNYLAAWGDRVVFSADDGVTGRKPWISDGTESGTYRLGGATLGTGEVPTDFTPVGGRIVFKAATGNDYELWASDGTPDSAVLVKDLVPGASSGPSELTRLGSQVVFVANEANRGHLYVTDGTAAETRMIAPGIDYPGSLTVLGDAVYFRAKDDAHGEELFRTRGTTESTVLVSDLEPGAGGSRPGALATLAGRLLLTATTTSKGEEPWISDGTKAGTRLVADLVPGATGSSPFPIGRVGASVVYAANGRGAGYEPWAWTVRGSTTKASPKRRYLVSQARHRQVKVLVRVTTPDASVTGGRVVLRKAGRVVGSAPVVRGRATVRITRRLGVGKHRLRASYSGSVQARSSASARFKITITRGRR